jgi:UDP-N-acetylglucosamine acyltransferase
MIHPTAIIHPGAKLDATVQVGPFAVIDAGVELGADCVVGPHVYLTGLTKIGAGNRFHAGCVIGDAPQDLKYKSEPTRLRIGDHNIFREHVTVHRSNKAGEDTIVGSHNFFMAHSHVAHNCAIGDHVILALMQGGAAISQDLPPFTIAQRENEICGLNVIGLRRAGFTAEHRLELKRLYHLLFRSGKNLREALAAARENFNGAPAKILLDFIAEAKRGVCPDSGHAAGSGDDE